MTDAPCDADLQELTLLQQRYETTTQALIDRLFTLHDAGFTLRELGGAIGRSESQVSRIIAQRRKSDTPVPTMPAATATELVRRAQRGEIDHERLVTLLETWQYEREYRSIGAGYDRELQDNGVEAVRLARDAGLLSDEEYEGIVVAAAQVTSKPSCPR